MKKNLISVAFLLAFVVQTIISFVPVNASNGNIVSAYPTPVLESVNNAITVESTCVRARALYYFKCSYNIPKGKFVFVYITSVPNYYKVVYIISGGKVPHAVVGWVKSVDIKYP